MEGVYEGAEGSFLNIDDDPLNISANVEVTTSVTEVTGEVQK